MKVGIRPTYDEIGEHLFIAATAVYVLFAIPAYFILQGRTGTVGTVDPLMAIGGLTVGSIIIIPAIHAFLDYRVEHYQVEKVLDSLMEDRTEGR